MVDKGPKRFRNELLRDSLIKFMEDIGIEAHLSNSMVKYFKAGIMHHLNLDDESLSKTKLEYLTYVERKLRFKGWKTVEKTKVAERIYAYRLSIMTLIGGDPYKLGREYPNFVQPTQKGPDVKAVEDCNLDFAHLPGHQITYLSIDVQEDEYLTEKDDEAITVITGKFFTIILLLVY